MTLQKVRGPSRDFLHKGLGCELGIWRRSLVAAGRLRERGVFEQNPRQEDDPPCLPERDRLETKDLGYEPVPQEVGGNGTDDAHERDDYDLEDADTDTERKLFQPVHFDLLKVLFSAALLPQRLPVFKVQTFYQG